MLCLDIVSCASITLQFRVVISGRGELPLIDEAGMNIQPNTATDIAMKYVSMSCFTWSSIEQFCRSQSEDNLPLMANAQQTGMRHTWVLEKMEKE